MLKVVVPAWIYSLLIRPLLSSALKSIGGQVVWIKISGPTAYVSILLCLDFFYLLLLFDHPPVQISSRPQLLQLWLWSSFISSAVYFIILNHMRTIPISSTLMTSLEWMRPCPASSHIRSVYTLTPLKITSQSAFIRHIYSSLHRSRWLMCQQRLISCSSSGESLSPACDF
ncbi:hypothetical protein CVT26_002609 [Gymnopilus dilepis]|uniref:Uncharacterized protein n=1 Tax=Gymnopilus dilepis TaxID=231916 RepID=A0A409VF73_9AGAR|nr:hypothetical protein CVT26_002609 [Gymnopilus dilepis]